MGTDYVHLLVQDAEGIRTIIMNRPEVLNALNAVMLDELDDAFTEAAADTSVRCVVLRGAGKAFGSGQDLRDFTALYASAEPIDVSPSLSRYHHILVTMRAAAKPIIAAVQGVAAGASCNLALACDLRVASEEARFVQAFARIGLVPDAGGAYLLPRLVGLGKAMELALLADEISGIEAARIGMVNTCVPAADFESTVANLAKRLAQGPTTAHARIKELIYRSAEGELAASLQMEIDAQNVAINTADHREGVMAFLQKRPPQYQGK